MSPQDLQRRVDRELLILDWRTNGIAYTAGLEKLRLLFVNMRFEIRQPPASQVIVCLGSLMFYQAWYDSDIGLDLSNVHIALVFFEQAAIAYCSKPITSPSGRAPAIDKSIPVNVISIFGR
jgi:hypothetical protein